MLIIIYNTNLFLLVVKYLYREIINYIYLCLLWSLAISWINHKSDQFQYLQGKPLNFWSQKLY